MSQEDVRLVKRGYEAFDAGDLDAVLAFVAPEIEVYEPKGGVEPMVRQGAEGLISSIENMREVWDEYGIEAEELIDLGDQVLVRVRMRGRGKGSGIPIDATVAHVWTVRDGKAIRLETWTNWSEAIAAAGARRD